MKVRFLCLSLLCLLFFGLQLGAETTSKTVVVDGYGVTRQESVQMALAEAIKQVHGVSVLVRQSVETNLQKWRLSIDGETVARLDNEEENSRQIREMTQGIVQTYRVLESEKVKGEWHSKLEVTLGSYIPPVSVEGLKKIAILPFDISQDCFMVHGKKVDYFAVAKDFNQKLVSGISQTRKLAVMDRDNISAYMREKSLLLSGESPLSEQLKLGQVLGVDYLLIGRIKDFKIESVPFTMSLTGEKSFKEEAQFLLSYRVVVMSTRQVKFSDEINIILDNEAIKNMDLKLTDDLKDIVLNQGAKKLVDKVMEDMYPLCIIRIIDNELVLNQGGNSVKIGERFNIFSVEGESMIDPYTKENLGSAEKQLGSLEITRVTPKISYGKRSDAGLISIPEGAICRREIAQP